VAETRRDPVRFVGGVGVKTPSTNSYSVTDLVVTPSTAEGFGIAFLEATASGTPELGFDLAGAIVRLLAAAEPDPHALAKTMCARFIRTVFHARMGEALDRLSSTA
jgi:hypothetical protein